MSLDPELVRTAEQIGQAVAKEDYENGFFYNDNGDDAKTHLTNIVDYALNKHRDEDAPELGRAFFQEVFMKMAIEEGKSGNDLTSPDALGVAVTAYWNSALSYIKQDIEAKQAQSLSPTM